ncbi:MAG: hypothetical protein H6835_18645 [Planctomycetes bacterium]|nr:hypothetical protein [Planctomycetota bacterium]
MKRPAERCARTDAVLAVHLDGDFTTGDCTTGDCTTGETPSRRDGARAPDRLEGEADDAEWGWGFVCDESLQQHLVECTVCQLALQRARRLDAALAADAGRAVADHLAAATGPARSWDEFGRALVDRALEAGEAAEGAACGGSSSGAPCAGGAADRVDRHEAAQAVTSNDALAGAPAAPRSGALLAASLLIGALSMTWLLLFTGHPGAPDVSRAADLPAPPAAAPTAKAGADRASTAFPLEAARRFSQAREGEGDLAHAPSPEELAALVADRTATPTVRIHAGEQLLRSARAARRDAGTDAFLRALASCGDGTADERELLRALLPQLRNAPLTNQLLQRLQPLLGDEQRDPPDLDTTAALVVALRVGGDRLDAALRRLLRARTDLDTIVTHGLRCATRDDGGAHLLLACWQDRVAIGMQEDDPAAALHWFHGMTPAAFVTVRQVLESSRSAPERVRCLLALGCVGDASTTACLLANLRSGRRLEACAACAALATLPHTALRPLLPTARRDGARRSDDALLRLALCRAGLAEAVPWLAAMELSERQRQQLCEAPLTRFTEFVGWFREGGAFAD